MNKKIVSLVVLVFSVFILASCSSSSNIFTYVIDSSYSEYLTMGTSADYPPYEWPVEENGKQTLVGIDIEIAKLIAAKAKKNLRVINKGFDFLLDDLEQGKVDFVMAGLTPTEKRAKQVDFSKIYYTASQVVLIKKDMLSIYEEIEDIDLSTVRIGAQLGSIQQDLVVETFKNAGTQYLQSVNDLVFNLQNGMLAGVVIEDIVGKNIAANISELAVSKIKIGEVEGGSAIAVQKGNNELLTMIDELINELIESKKIDEIVNKVILGEN